MSRTPTLALLALAFGSAGAATPAAPPAQGPPRRDGLARQDATRVLVRQPLDRRSYPAALREALLGLGADLTVLDAVGAASAAGGGALDGGTLDLLTLPIPQTGLQESYLFFTPPAPVAPTPLLVHFHAAGTSAYDLVFFTDFLAEAEARNWYVLAPFQIVSQSPATSSYSTLPSQFHVDEVLAWAIANHTLDLDRIYGYGFSMGGGNALNYAARHLERARGTFAALANHTGTLSLPDEYRNARSPKVLRPILEGLFGGSPTARPFEYLRSSVLDLDEDGRLVLGGDHVAVNLAHVPIQSWFATGDPQAHLVAQARRLDELFGLLPGTNHTLVPVNGDQHVWDTLDEVAVCNWFATHSLALPRGGELRVDRSAKFLHFDLTVAATDRFAHLFHDARPERLSVTETENLVEVRTAAAEAGLDPAQVPFELLIDAAAGAPPRVVITGFTRAPSAARRDGDVAVTGWAYDALNQVLTIDELDGATHLWRFE